MSIWSSVSGDTLGFEDEYDEPGDCEPTVHVDVATTYLPRIRLGMFAANMHPDAPDAECYVTLEVAEAVRAKLDYAIEWLRSRA